MRLLPRTIPAGAARDLIACSVTETTTMEKDPHRYLDEIRENLKKIQAQGRVTPTENALFGMIDGMAGLQLALMEQLADTRRRLQALEAAAAAT